MTTETLHYESARAAQQLYAGDEKNLRLLETELAVKATARDGWIKLDGEAEAVASAKRLFQTLERGQQDGGGATRPRDFAHAVAVVKNDGADALDNLFSTRIATSGKKSSITPKTLGQQKYVQAIREHDVTFGIGPAGTGKTYLAMAMAVAALKEGKVNRIILTRPAVEAGERLGFLPGDLMAKVDPYLRPLYDALHDMLEPEGAAKLLDKQLVEVAPLAFMRGRTLNNSFIILDEAQNTTPEQMKMFLTRIGFNSRVIVNGDLTQVDVAGGRSGLAGLERILAGIENLTFVHLSTADVVRHKIVADIVAAYERAGGGTNGTDAPAPAAAPSAAPIAAALVPTASTPARANGVDRG